MVGKIDYILAFTIPIYEMIRVVDIDKPYFHLIYEMWDDMTAKVKLAFIDMREKSYLETLHFWK